MNGDNLSGRNISLLSAALYLWCLVILGALLAVTAQAGESRARSSLVQMPLELEGRRFVGPFGAEGEKNPKQDAFTFKDGNFATASCLEWGFSPAPYWVRRDAKGLHFLAELKSPDHGTMRYEGVFDGGTLTVVGYWRKERWYWTVERTYRGEGRLSKPVSN
jgi:hypothetical protein